MKPTVNSLYADHDEMIRRTIYCMVRDFPDAVCITQELSQEVWVKVIKNLSCMDESSNFGAWILRIARNHTIDYMRKVKGRRKHETISEEQVQLMDQIAPQPTSDPLLERYILQETIQATYGKMRPVEAIVSYFVANGYPKEEIPAIIEEKLGMTYQKNTIRSLLSDSRANFKSAYKQQMNYN